MTNRQLVAFYRWLPRLAREFDAESEEGAADSLRRAAEDRLGREASRKIGVVGAETDGLVGARGWAIRYLSDVMRGAPGLKDRCGSDGSFVGYHEDITAIRASIGDLAKSHHPVLLIGERGAGKGQLMRAIHRELGSSGRSSTMHLFSLAATPTELADSELFGHEKGAFTGATNRRLGAFRTAAESGKALFLDDIGECPMPVQAKLLSALDDGIIRPVGSDSPVSIGRGAARKLKVFASIQPRALCNLRSDLLDRLWWRTQVIPPLRRRGLDVLLLADLALEACSSSGGEVRPRFTNGVRERLLDDPLPGNVRELISVVNRTFVACGGRPELDVAALSAARRVDHWLPRNEKAPRDPGPQPFDGPEGFLTLEQATDRHIREALRRSEGNLAEAARQLGMPRTTLDSRLTRRAGQRALQD